MQTKLNKIVILTVTMTFIVIVLGAYTRLKDAGLGCPDWPGCYGKFLAPEADTKAWTEMVHRYVAGSLGILILYLAIQAIRNRRQFPKLWLAATFVVLLVIFQALLGMWTVTLGLYPVIVMGHLLGGFAILAGLWLLYLQLAEGPNINLTKQHSRQLKFLATLSTIALISQIALGGWTSSNYAALVCADFPTCQGQLWPAMDWQSAFNFIQVGIFESPGMPLENSARVTIQMAHRLGALFSTILICLLCSKLYFTKVRILIILAKTLFVLLAAQISLGISNILAGLPLIVSLMHSAIAALLLICLITIMYFLYAKNHTV